VFNSLAQALLVPGITDTQCGFKAFRADAGRAVFEHQLDDGFAFDVEVLHLARRLGHGVFVAQVLPLMKQAFDYHAAEEARVALLAQASAGSFTVAGLGVAKPDVLPSDGLSTNESSWVNLSVARYYALGSVRVDELA
jgi:hypothetical protein